MNVLKPLQRYGITTSPDGGHWADRGDMGQFTAAVAGNVVMMGELLRQYGEESPRETVIYQGCTKEYRCGIGPWVTQWNAAGESLSVKMLAVVPGKALEGRPPCV